MNKKKQTFFLKLVVEIFSYIRLVDEHKTDQ